MDIDDSSYSRWSYATSYARSEPISNIRPMSNYRPKTPQSATRLPPIPVPPAPVQTSIGVWEDDDGVYYAANWPPVQEYLDLIRKERRMIVAPSEIIFALAALHVVQCPWDVAHWILWPSSTYYNTADRVTAVALHQPRLIVTKVPWVGSREYRWIINAVQEKYYYVHVLKKWYPTDFQLLEPKKRSLRSNGSPDDRQDATINQHFNIVEEGTPPLKRLRRTTKRSQPSSEEQPSRTTTRPKKTVPSPTKPTPSPDSVEPADISVGLPLARSPSTLAETPANGAIPDNEPSAISDLSSSLHSRNRSTSQSSEQTVVANNTDPSRSASVESSNTIVATSLAKKRKADVLDEDGENQDASPQLREGMITRGRSMKIHQAESVSKRTAVVIPLSPRIKPMQPKAKSRKSRT